LHSPVVKSVARWARKQPFIWDGIYERFDQAPVVGKGFASEEWLSDMERYTHSAVAAIAGDSAMIPENVPQYHVLLASLISSFDASDRPVRVLDFGGGMGIGFANVRRCVSGGMGFEYFVVDNEERRRIAGASRSSARPGACWTRCCARSDYPVIPSSSPTS
jgi:putative methyltransferase (TIGR04325 family)